MGVVDLICSYNEISGSMTACYRHLQTLLLISHCTELHVDSELLHNM